jgi:hypothetical protein
VMIRNATKITAVTGAAVLSFGLAAPAFANNTSDPTDTTPTAWTHAHAHMSLTLDQFRALVTKNINERVAWIDKAEARVTASTKLTDAEKTAATAKLTSAHDALTALRTTVAAATTKSAIRDAVQAAEVQGKLLRADRKSNGQRAARRSLCSNHAKSGDPSTKADVKVASIRVDSASAVPRERTSVRTVSFNHRGGDGQGNRANGHRGHHGHHGQHHSRGGGSRH